MKEPMKLGDILLEMADKNQGDWGRLLRHCPFIQAQLIKQGKMSLDDLSDSEIEDLSQYAFLEDWIDGQEVMQKLHISPRTLQTLRSNGTVPYTRIGHKLYYLKADIERILKSNYVMFNIRERYGKDI